MSKVSERTSLYRFFGARDELLYVGITNCLPNRFTDHDRTKHWWFRVERTTIEHFFTRAAAEYAEQRAIENESPRFNIQHGQTVEDMLHRPEPDVEAVLDRSLASSSDVTFDLLESIDRWTADAQIDRRSGLADAHVDTLGTLAQLVVTLLIIKGRGEDPEAESTEHLCRIRHLVWRWLDENHPKGWEEFWRWDNPSPSVSGLARLRQRLYERRLLRSVDSRHADT